MATNTSVAEIKICVADDEDKRNKLIQRGQWLRAAILGANDGLLSTTSLMLGVSAAKDDDQKLMIISGLAGALAGACSMAVGEFVSVSTQREIEERAKNEVDTVKNQESTHVQSDSIIITSSSPPERLNGLISPARSPLNIIVTDARENPMEEETSPNPCKAAVASGVAFLFGSLVPLLSALVFSKGKMRVAAIVVVASIALAVFGGVGARLGGSRVRVSAARVLVGGWIAMGVTYGLLVPLNKD